MTPPIRHGSASATIHPDGRISLIVRRGGVLSAINLDELRDLQRAVNDAVAAVEGTR